jgi:hypothetical protein
MFSNLTFWYHLPWSEIKSMPFSAINLYMDRLPMRIAEIKMMMGEAAKLPHMDEDGRREWARNINDVLRKDKPQKVSSPAMLRKAGIGVQVVKKEK